MDITSIGTNFRTGPVSPIVSIITGTIESTWKIVGTNFRRVGTNFRRDSVHNVGYGRVRMDNKY